MKQADILLYLLLRSKRLRQGVFQQKNIVYVMFRFEENRNQVERVGNSEFCALPCEGML